MTINNSSNSYNLNLARIDEGNELKSDQAVKQIQIHDKVKERVQGAWNTTAETRDRVSQLKNEHTSEVLKTKTEKKALSERKTDVIKNYSPSLLAEIKGFIQRITTAFKVALGLEEPKQLHASEKQNKLDAEIKVRKENIKNDVEKQQLDQIITELKSAHSVWSDPLIAMLEMKDVNSSAELLKSSEELNQLKNFLIREKTNEKKLNLDAEDTNTIKELGYVYAASQARVNESKKDSIIQLANEFENLPLEFRKGTKDRIMQEIDAVMKEIKRSRLFLPKERDAMEIHNTLISQHNELIEIIKKINTKKEKDNVRQQVDRIDTSVKEAPVEKASGTSLFERFWNYMKKVVETENDPNYDI